LLQRYGYGAVLASDGGQAVELLKKREFSAVVLDLMMPEYAGAHVISFLAESDSRIPVIVCTAAGPASTANLDTKIVKAVIRKPFDIDQYIATITGLVGAAAPLARVVVVDDDMRARYVMRAFVEPAEITEIEHGDDAVDIIRSSLPDVVLLDLHLPGTPGETVLQKLRETVETSTIPVIVVTSHKLDDAARERLLKSAAGVIYKGDLSRETLQQALKAIGQR
jgi:CheY-like chemotaxis protein